MSFFKNIFSTKETLPPIELSIIGTDVHSHLIPGIDDGAKTVDESIEMLKKMRELGFRKVITTPHIMSDFYKNTPDIILSGLKKLRKVAQENKLDIEIKAAAEYYLDYEVDAKIGKEKLLTFGNNYLLFEQSFVAETPNLNNSIFEMITNGYTPVLAHVERYIYWHQNYAKYEELKTRGVLFQLNINSLSGYYGPGIKKIAEKLVTDDMIDFIGTDAHQLEQLEQVDYLLTNPYLHQLVNKENLLNKTL